MNYIKLINAFYDRLETNPLSTSAIALWHALVNVNNKSGWIKEFTVAVSVLRVKTGLSEKTVTNARNELKQKGYLDFRSRKGNQSAVYLLFDLSVTVTDKITDSLSVNASDSLSGSPSDNASALLNETKRNKTKDKDEEARGEIFRFYEQEGFGTLSGFTGDILNDLIDNYGTEKVFEALKETRVNGSRSLNYAKKILTNPMPKKQQAGWKRKAAGERSLYEPSSETLERQRRAIENFVPQDIDDSDLPF